jgi:hypothetical protein
MLDVVMLKMLIKRECKCTNVFLFFFYPIFSQKERAFLAKEAFLSAYSYRALHL